VKARACVVLEPSTTDASVDCFIGREPPGADGPDEALHDPGLPAASLATLMFECTGPLRGAVVPPVISQWQASTTSRMISSGCRAMRPVPCAICCRQETPVAAMIVSSASARTAGKSRSSPMLMESS